VTRGINIPASRIIR